MDGMRGLRMALFIGAAALGLLLTAGTALAHGGAEITVEPMQAAAGDEVAVSGEGFEANSDVMIKLEGMAGTFTVVTGKTSDAGELSLTAKVPANMKAGDYQLVAEGGDEAVRLDFVVTAASASVAPMESGEVVYQRTAADTWAAAVLAGLLAMGGFGLLVASHRAPRRVTAS